MDIKSRTVHNNLVVSLISKSPPPSLECSDSTCSIFHGGFLSFRLCQTALIAYSYRVVVCVFFERTGFRQKSHVDLTFLLCYAIPTPDISSRLIHEMLIGGGKSLSVFLILFLKLNQSDRALSGGWRAPACIESDRSDGSCCCVTQASTTTHRPRIVDYKICQSSYKLSRVS